MPLAIVGGTHLRIQDMMHRMMVTVFSVLFFGCSPLATSATDEKESLPVPSGFPVTCTGPYQDKKPPLETISEEVQAHEKWLLDSNDPKGHQANFCGADLTQSNFQGRNLTAAIFQMAMLTGANFSGTTLNRAQFQGANLSGANFTTAHLEEANFDYAMLHLAFLRQANLHLASLHHTMLNEANFQDAVLDQTNLQDVDLRNVEKLTQTQVNKACLRENAKLPKGLLPPIPCRNQHKANASQNRALSVKKGPQPDETPLQKTPNTTSRNKTTPPQRGLIAPRRGRTKFSLALIAPPADSTLSGPIETFTWKTAPDVQEFFLHIGTSLGPLNHPLTTNIFKEVISAAEQSVTVQNLPTDGSDVYVRFGYKKANTWTANDQLHFKAFSPSHGHSPF